MNFSFLASLILFILLISINIKRQTRVKKEQEDAFWEKERRANSVRKKSLNDLDYISIPLESFPTHCLKDNPEATECIGILEALTSQKVVNLTGYSNTDLKLKYGTANINLLTEYDQNYTVMVRTLQKWADLLLEAGYEKEAVTLMEFAVITGTDISKTYFSLADYYTTHNRSEQIDFLISTAGSLRSSNKERILKQLRENHS